MLCFKSQDITNTQVKERNSINEANYYKQQYHLQLKTILLRTSLCTWPAVTDLFIVSLFILSTKSTCVRKSIDLLLCHVAVSFIATE